MKPDTKSLYDKDAIEIVYAFSKQMIKEFGEMIKVIAVFGSQAKKNDLDPHSDIDVLVVIDDAKFSVDNVISETYRTVTAKILEKISKRIHVTTMKLTNFWEHSKTGDPVLVNILRDGYAVIDTGFFEPMQILLFQGRIKPSQEAIYAYYERAPRNLRTVEYGFLRMVSELYWAMIDASHAALMRIGEMPATPKEVPRLIEEKFVKTKIIEQKHADFAKEIYELSKKVAHNQIISISGAEIDNLKEKASEYVEEMRKIVSNFKPR